MEKLLKIVKLNFAFLANFCTVKSVKCYTRSRLSVTPKPCTTGVTLTHILQYLQVDFTNNFQNNSGFKLSAYFWTLNLAVQIKELLVVL